MSHYTYLLAVDHGWRKEGSLWVEPGSHRQWAWTDNQLYQFTGLIP